MDLFDVVRSCFRRWYVVLPLLLIVGWFSYEKYTSAQPVYYSNAVISLAPPNSRLDQSEAGVPVPRNGLLDVGGPTLITNLVTLGLRDPSTVAQVVAAGGQPDYYAKMFPVPATSPELPLIMIEATESDPTAASKTVESAAAQVAPALQSLQQQAGVPDDQMVKSFLASPPSAPVEGMPSRTRTTVAVLLAGVGLVIVLGVVVDMLLIGWKARRQKRRPIPADAAGSAVGDDDEPRVGATGVHRTSEHSVADEVAIDRR